jgi:predicted nucleotidyltransferase
MLGELLAWLFLHPEKEFTGAELAKRIGTSPASTSREADRLVGAGLVRERRLGNLRLLRAETDSIVAKPLQDLLSVTYGPLPILALELGKLANVTEAYIYGSWAARYGGEPGPIPRDVDVLVVGDADEDELYDAARAAESVLAREVNIRRVSAEAWAAEPGSDPFLQTIRARPLVALIVGAPWLARAGGTGPVVGAA